jgi:hypothetical protein
LFINVKIIIIKVSNCMKVFHPFNIISVTVINVPFNLKNQNCKDKKCFIIKKNKYLYKIIWRRRKTTLKHEKKKKYTRNKYFWVFFVDGTK